MGVYQMTMFYLQVSTIFIYWKITLQSFFDRRTCMGYSDAVSYKEKHSINSVSIIAEFVVIQTKAVYIFDLISS
jgi:hypothetical protein